MTDLVGYRSSSAYGTDLRARLCPTLTRTGEQLQPAKLEERADTQEEYERTIVGWASVTGAPYEMHDFFGEYSETIAPGAFKRSLLNSPEVAHRIEHQGLGVASTRSGTLTLLEDDIGLRFRSIVDTRESDASDLVRKLERGVASHTSFAFRIVEYLWNEDFDDLTITDIELDRGDVASCCYGANPAGSHAVIDMTAAAENSAREDWASAVAEDMSAAIDADHRDFWKSQWLGRVTQVAYDLTNEGAS